MGMDGQQHALVALPLGHRHGSHFTGGKVCPRDGLDGCGKARPTGILTRIFQPVACRYTD